MNHQRFTFYNPEKLIDNNLELILTKKISPEANKIEPIPVYKFEMRLRGTRQKIGYINFRVDNTQDIIMYAGHLGYGVIEKHRGNRYAAKSCQFLFPLAKKHKINPVWITCNPENLASRKTCEIAGGKLIEIVDLPKDNDQYLDGDRQKCRYRFDL